MSSQFTSERPGVIAVAAVLLIIYGLIIVISGIATVFFWTSIAVSAHSHHTEYHLYPLGILGLIAVVFGVLKIVSGWLLWNMKRSGALLAVIVMAFYLALSFIPVTGISIIWLISLLFKIVFTIIILVLIVQGWQYLK
ncbi:hypothetical protein J4526_07370 [Desulfurococcaceae archaeon MEX13E-LK6-19]|nr:hypothetical protein J4526_07370 [Desulfurococcaceae archaeon MEX13E-LK6-19]